MMTIILHQSHIVKLSANLKKITLPVVSALSQLYD